MGNIQYTHMGGWLDVMDLMSHLDLGPPPLPLFTIQFGLMRKQETKGGGLRTAVALALLLVYTAVATWLSKCELK